MAFSRRFPRSRIARKLRGRRTFRKAKRIIRRVRRKLRKRTARKARRKQHLVAYAYSSHTESTHSTTVVSGLGTTDDTTGLFSRGDLDKIFDQVVNLDDPMYAGQVAVNGQLRMGRHNIKVRARGEAIYTITNGNTVGGAFVQFYIARPRKDIVADGIGVGNAVTIATIYNNNLNSLFQPDYNDAAGYGVNAAGTGGVTNIMQNSTSAIKPTINTQDAIWHTPFMVPEVTQNFKILTVKKVYIPAGGVFMFKIKTPWQYFERSEMQIRASGNQAGGIHRNAKGRDLLVKAWGQPVHDQASHTAVNVGQVTLDTIVSKRYWFSASARATPRFYHMGNALGTVGTAQLPGFADQTNDES